MKNTYPMANLFCLCFLTVATIHCSVSDFSGNGSKKKSNDSGDDSDTDLDKKGDDKSGLEFGESETLPGGEDLENHFDNLGEFGNDSEPEIRQGSDGWTLVRLTGKMTTPSDMKIAIAIDTSGSMQDAIDKINTQVPKMTKKFLQSPKNSLYLISKDYAGVNVNFPAEVTGLKNFDHQIKWIQNCDALVKFAELAEEKGTAKLPMDDKGSLHFLVLTDDNATNNCPDGGAFPEGITADVFKTRLAATAAPKEVKFHGFVFTGETTFAACGGTGKKVIGSTYTSLKDHYGGKTQDICKPEAEWPGMFDYLLDEMRKSANVEVVIKDLPEKVERIHVRVNGKFIQESEYTLDQDAKSLRFVTPPEDDALIEIFIQE
jgi:hypothetical protein